MDALIGCRCFHQLHQFHGNPSPRYSFLMSFPHEHIHIIAYTKDYIYMLRDLTAESARGHKSTWTCTPIRIIGPVCQTADNLHKLCVGPQQPLRIRILQKSIASEKLSLLQRPGKVRRHHELARSKIVNIRLQSTFADGVRLCSLTVRKERPTYGAPLSSPGRVATF